jgi:hypothetical protein
MSSMPLLVWTAARYAAVEARTVPDEMPLPGFGEVIWNGGWWGSLST